MSRRRKIARRRQRDCRDPCFWFHGRGQHPIVLPIMRLVFSWWTVPPTTINVAGRFMLVAPNSADESSMKGARGRVRPRFSSYLARHDRRTRASLFFINTRDGPDPENASNLFVFSRECMYNSMHAVLFFYLHNSNATAQTYTVLHFPPENQVIVFLRIAYSKTMSSAMFLYWTRPSGNQLDYG